MEDIYLEAIEIHHEINIQEKEELMSAIKQIQTEASFHPTAIHSAAQPSSCRSDLKEEFNYSSDHILQGEVVTKTLFLQRPNPLTMDQRAMKNSLSTPDSNSRDGRNMSFQLNQDNTLTSLDQPPWKQE